MPTVGQCKCWSEASVGCTSHTALTVLSDHSANSHHGRENMIQIVTYDYICFSTHAVPWDAGGHSSATGGCRRAATRFCSMAPIRVKDSVTSDFALHAFSVFEKKICVLFKRRRGGGI